MTPSRNPFRYLGLAMPITALVLAVTAVPTRPRAPTLAAISGFDFDPLDVVENVLGYVPLGAVLGTRTVQSTLGVATAISGLAEVSQFFAEGRSPSLIDLLTNITGAALGWGLGSRFGIPARIRINRFRGVIAAALSLVYLSGGIDFSPHDVERNLGFIIGNPSLLSATGNSRGLTTPGRLEAHWKLDDSHDDVTPDSSENGLDGKLINEPMLVAGIDSRAVWLNGFNQYVDFGHPAALALSGSMTISAWINSSKFPRDDAAIVSSHNGLGYQLDTTVDQGARTVGFKLANTSGRLMARYGKTHLVTDRWYHVAGVYDAEARTLTVYLNGRVDNDCLLGEVTNRQRISGLDVYIGKRGIPPGYEFAGAIDDVRIYSRALTLPEILSDIRTSTNGERLWANSHAEITDSFPARTGEVPCPDVEPTDVRSAAIFLAFGQLIAVTCVGLWPTPNYKVWSLLFAVAVGLVLAPVAARSTSSYLGVVVALLIFAGGVSITAATNTKYEQP
jgi:VanZ family protein